MDKTMEQARMMSSAEAAKWLSERDNFLILTHLRPDGDTLGSAAGLCSALREAGKTAYVLRNKQTTRRYEAYLAPYWSEDFRPDYVISTDIATENLFPVNAEIYKGRVDLAIDHHPSNSWFAKNSLVDASCAACGEIVYRVAMDLNGKVGPETAKLLFIALTTDTGCFRYGNTTADTHRIAAALIDAGAPGTEINKKLFRTKTRGRVLIESEMLNNIEFTRDSQIATVVVTREMIERAGADEDDLEDIAAIHGQIEGVVVSITIRELEDGTSKVSVRTNKLVDAGAICAELGGGGHAMAAGVSLNCGVWEAKEKILAAVDKVWK